LLAAIALLPLASQHAMAYENSFFGAQRPFTGQPFGPVAAASTLGCLNSRAPQPYPEDYIMRCPSSANISDWFDKEGAQHRLIRHAPLKGVTPNMMRWCVENV
jgi:hypothetical protein